MELTRRSFMQAMLAAAVAPAFIGSSILMPVRQLIVPSTEIVDSRGMRLRHTVNIGGNIPGFAGTWHNFTQELPPGYATDPEIRRLYAQSVFAMTAAQMQQAGKIALS